MTAKFSPLETIPLRNQCGPAVTPGGVRVSRWDGIALHETSHAVEAVTVFSVIKNPKRRRRAYSVSRDVEYQPCCIMLADGSMAVHPEIIAKLRAIGAVDE